MTDTVGRRLAATTCVDEWLKVEAETGRVQRFSAVEELVVAAVSTSFAGKLPVNVTSVGNTTTVTLKHLPVPVRTMVTDVFDIAVQQAKGAWGLPESVVLTPGVVNVPAYFATEPRWAMNAAATVAGRVAFPGSPDALACWALLVPFADVLLAPLKLRGPSSGALAPDERDAAWAAVDTTYLDLGLTGEAVVAAVAVMRPGHGWSRLSCAEQTAARAALIGALRDSFGPDTVRRWRVVGMRPLLARYYAKATRGQPTARAVLVKALQPVLAASFGGDWLALLEYLDEQPAAGEEITTALPEARLYVQASAKVERVAAEQNLAVDAVAQMLASYLGSNEIRSPVERRVEVLRSFWAFFDATHARQAPGMRPLTGLVSERWLDSGERAPFLTPTYERLLPASMLADIDALWGGYCVPRYPDRIVSALFPHAEMAAAFGLALTFWHNIAVTTWHFCEGPYSRTDINGMAEYYARDVDALAASGTPVSPELFTDLKAAQRRLGRPQDIVTDRTAHEVAHSISIEMSMGGGTRRDGFEIVRDVITGHRRAWAKQHLGTALLQAWEEPLREVARQVNLSVVGRGKLPTVKQFAKLGAPVANAWFGGDLTALNAAVGEKGLSEQRRVRLQPYDRAGLCNRVFEALGGHFAPNSSAGDGAAYQQSWDMGRVAIDAPRFVQLEELLDRPPTAKEFDAPRYNWPDGLTYDRYAEVVTELRATLPTVRPAAVLTPTPVATPVIRVASSTRPDTPAAQHPAPVESVVAAQPLDTPGRAARRSGMLRRLFGRNESASQAPPAAGWYPDPHIPGQVRWWDGAVWTADVRGC